MDQEDDNFATGINTCLTKDGQNTPTANLPMGGNRHTGVGNGAARTDYVAVNQIQDGDLYLVGSVAGTNTITGSLTPAITAYTVSMRVLFLPAATNTGAVTLNLNSVGAQAIVKNNGAALVAGDLVSGVWADCIYDLANTRWVLINPQIIAVAAGGTGSTTASAARTALGVAIGSNVQAWDTNLDQIAALAVTDSNFIVGNGTAWVTESGATARTSLGLGSLSTASTINNDNWSGTDLSILNGGTGASTASAARTALGVAIGTDVQAWDTNLDQIAALAVTDGNVIVGNGTAWIVESGATARASLGVSIGSNVQAWDANLDQIAALAVTDSNFIVGNGTAWVAESGATARTSLGLGSLATASSINNSNWSGTDLALVNGGTGASDAATARTNLGLGSSAVIDEGNLAINTDQLTTDYANADTSTTYTVGSGDAESIRRFTSSSAITITLPNSVPTGWSVGDSMGFIRGGTGTLTFSSAGTIRSPGSSAITVQNGKAVVTLAASGEWEISGNV